VNRRAAATAAILALVLLPGCFSIGTHPADMPRPLGGTSENLSTIGRGGHTHTHVPVPPLLIFLPTEIAADVVLLPIDGVAALLEGGEPDADAARGTTQITAGSDEQRAARRTQLSLRTACAAPARPSGRPWQTCG